MVEYQEPKIDMPKAGTPLVTCHTCRQAVNFVNEAIIKFNSHSSTGFYFCPECAKTAKECTCMCHRSKGVKHVVACCNAGWKSF